MGARSCENVTPVTETQNAASHAVRWKFHCRQFGRLLCFQRAASGLGPLDFVVDFGQWKYTTDRGEIDALSEIVKLDEVPVVFPLTSPVFNARLVVLDQQVFDQRREFAVLLGFPAPIIVP